MVSRNADLHREWKDITSAHGDVIEDYRTSFDDLIKGDPADPLAVVGAYGSGKTQLMYQIFREAWERDIGAVYIGDPGKLLSEFEEAAESDIETWLEERIQEEIEYYVEGDPENVTWFPSTGSEQKQDWLETKVAVDDPSEISKYAILVDEIEQHYEDFLAAVETDDGNPLRVINDEVPNTLKVWSFGMLSAYEFLGEADWRRLKELRVPPLDIEEITDQLEEHNKAAANLANIIWWMGRGRTGLIIKLIDELPRDINENIAEWVQSMADTESQGTPIINDIWANLKAEHWDTACQSLSFQNGYENWLMQDTQGYSSETMSNIVSDIIFNKGDFSDEEYGKPAKRIIKRNVERVFDAVTRPSHPNFPYKALIFEDEEVEGLFSLIEDQILTFEPKGMARRIAIEALEITPDEFSSEFYTEESSKTPIESKCLVPKLSILDSAFQPIALNPDLVTSESTESLRKSMESALEFNSKAAHEGMSVYFCPTEDVLNHQLKVEKNKYDITSPSVIIAPKELTEEISDEYSTFKQLKLINIAPTESSVLWDFVVNLQGALEEQGLNPNQAVDDTSRQQLLEAVDTRDARNTIDTLFDQLQRVANDESTKATTDYVDRYSLPNESTLLWENPRLQDKNPFWTSGSIRELTRTQAYLLLLSDPPEFSRPSGNIHTYIQTAIDEDLISSGNAFPYKEFLSELYAESGYGSKLTTERNHYFDQNRLVDGVRNAQNALFRLAKEFNLELTANSLNSIETSAEDGDITVLDIDMSRNALSFLRALLMSKIASIDGDAFDLENELCDLSNELGSYKSDFDAHLDTINTYDEILTQPSCTNVGNWPGLDSNKYLVYKETLENLVNGIDDLRESCNANSSINPYAWAYLLILEEFVAQVSRKADKYEMKLHSVNLNNVELLKASYTDLYNTIDESDVVAQNFDSENKVLAQLEHIGNDIFDFGSMNNIPLPGYTDHLSTIDNDAQKNIEDIEDVRQLVERLHNQQQAVDDATEGLKDDLHTLLQHALDIQEGKA